MEESVGHELLQFPRDLHECVHLLPLGGVSLLVVLQHVAPGELAADVPEERHHSGPGSAHSQQSHSSALLGCFSEIW